MDSATTVDTLKAWCAAFRDARDWKKFHNPKDLALSLSIEAAEIMELYRFKDATQMEADLGNPHHREALGHEMADVLYWLLMLSDHTGIDLASALRGKLEVNEKRYPAALAFGKNLKYTELAVDPSLRAEPGSAPTGG